MNKETALGIQHQALEAIKALLEILNRYEQECSAEEQQQLRRGVGLSIGKIQIDLLQPICAQYPEIDDLKDFPDADSDIEPR